MSPTPQVLAVANLKGGTGKTTCAVNLAAALARRGSRVLLLDFDPQGSATTWLRSPDSGSGIVEAMRVRDLAGVVANIGENLDLSPSGEVLAVAGAAMLGGAPLPTVLAETLAGSSLPYDFILIDCPPSAGPLVYNALAASTAVLVPVEASTLALGGLAQFETLVKGLSRVAPSLRVVGVQPARVGRTAHAREVLVVLARTYGPLLLPEIPDAVALRDAAAYHQSIFGYDPKHKAAQAFDATAAAIVERLTTNG